MTSCPTSKARPPYRRRAFTLIEMIAVLIIMSIMMGLAVLGV